MARIVICKECARGKKHHAKGLCQRCYDRIDYQKNPEKERAYQRQRRKDNPEKLRGYNRQWKKENPEKLHACNRRWKKENPRRVRAYNREWRAENAGRVATYNARRRTREKSLPNTLTGEQANHKLSSLPCFYCGTDIDLTLDHFVGLATKGNAACGTTLANSVVACLSCNSGKGTKLPREVLGQLTLL